MARDRRETPAFLSTSVIARLFAIRPEELRARIEIGALPEPDWVRVGSKRERVYSLEWVALAAEQMNAQRLPGFDQELIVPPDGIQLALRFDQPNWTPGEIAATLSALQRLWDACLDAVEPDAEAVTPRLDIRRMSAGSPLDLLIWARDATGLLIGAGGAATLLVFLDLAVCCVSHGIGGRDIRGDPLLH